MTRQTTDHSNKLTKDNFATQLTNSLIDMFYFYTKSEKIGFDDFSKSNYALRDIYSDDKDLRNKIKEVIKSNLPRRLDSNVIQDEIMDISESIGAGVYELLNEMLDLTSTQRNQYQSFRMCYVFIGIAFEKIKSINKD